MKDKFKYHPSVLKIKTEINITGNSTLFEFSNVTPQQVSDQIRVLRTNKSTRGNIPIKIIKIISKVCNISLTDCINSAINNGTFPDELKLGDVTPILKKDDATNKSNFRPITLLHVISKIYAKGVLANRLMVLCQISYLLTYVVLEKDIAHITPY